MTEIAICDWNGCHRPATVRFADGHGIYHEDTYACTDHAAQYHSAAAPEPAGPGLVWAVAR